MKLSTRHKIELFIFVCMLLISFSLFRPFVRVLESKVSSLREKALAELEQTYHIRISYESLSPSVLRSISLKNVKIYDADNGAEIAACSDFSIRYRFLALLTGKIPDILDSVFIADGFIDFDMLENKGLASALRSLIRNPSTDTQIEYAEDRASAPSVFSSGIESLTVDIKNIQIRLKDAVQNVQVRISEGSCRIDSESLSVSLNASASYKSGTYPQFGQAETAFTIEGKCDKDITAGSAVVNIAHLSSQQFSVQHIKVFTAYRNNLLTFNTMQDFQPFDFIASWNLENNTVTGGFKCRDYMPMRSVALYTAPKLVKQLEQLEMSGSARFSLGAGTVDWGADMTFRVPQLSFPAYQMDPMRIDVTAEGDDKDITVSRLAVKGAGIDIFSRFGIDMHKKLPSGIVQVNAVRLPSGADVSADVRFSERNGEFVCNIGSLSVGEALLHNIGLKLRPSDEKIDYFISAEDESGKYACDGSYIYNMERSATGAAPFWELHGAFDAVNIGTVYRFAEALYPPAHIPQPAALESVRCTTEFYISSDLHNFSYNCVRLVLVSEALNDFYALLSVKGNQSSFALTDIDISYKNMYVRGGINAEFENLNDIIFNSDLIVNSIGYHIQGFYSQNILNIYGDYGLAISALYNQETGIKGTVKSREMPLPFLPLFLTLDSDFHYTDNSDWGVIIDEGMMSYGSPVSLAQTALAMSFHGSLDSAGLFLSGIKLGSDDVLTGTIAVSTPAPDQTGSNAYHGEINLMSAATGERLECSAGLSFDNGIMIDGSLNIENMALARFFRTQGKGNTLTAQAVFSGTPDNLILQCSMPQLSWFIQGHDLLASGDLRFENNRAELVTGEASWGAHRVSGIAGYFSLSDLTGMLDADYAGEAVHRKMGAHVNTVFTGVVPEDAAGGSAPFAQLGSLFQQCTITTNISNWQFGQSSGTEAVPISFIREKEVTALYAGKNDEITGFILGDGVVSLQCAESLPLHFVLDGSIKKDALDLRFTDVYADVKRVWDITGMDYVLFYGGSLAGNVAIRGTPQEPEFYGKLEGQDIRVNSPHYIPEIFGPVALDVLADGTTLEVPYTVLHGPSADLWGRCTVAFSEWIPAEVFIQCGTLNEKKGKLKTDNLLFKAEGLAGCTADITITPALISLYGSAAFDSGFFAFKFNEMDKFQAKYAGKNGPAFNMKLDLQLGKKAEFRWPTADIPILRALIPTETPITLTVGGENGSVSMKGSVRMRGGEVFYLKRNFYIREGNVEFTDLGGDIDPLVTVRAEIRDRDEKGEALRIILTAKEQRLSQFTPELNSEPSRSSLEIMQLLGQAFVGDTKKESALQNILVTSSDLLAQIGFLKKSENAIRDFLRLDAFSFRTLVLQNAIFGNLFNANRDKSLTISNYFDNTSVYIGKYFGSAIYADALLHLSYYDEKSLKNGGTKRPVYNNLLFQPEIGLEMATPFFLLRWSVAPTKPETLFVGDAALTFSWKYAY